MIKHPVSLPSLLVLTSAVSLLLAGQARAADCHGLLSSLQAYLHQSNLNSVSSVVTTNQSDRGFASVTNVRWAVIGSEWRSQGQQYFSDRYWRPTGNTYYVPFNPNGTDNLGVFIETAGPVVVKFQLNSWGGSVTTVPAQCEGTVMSGTFPGGNSNFTVSFTRGQLIP